MTSIISIVNSGLVMNESSTESEKSLAWLIELVGNQGSCYHHTIEVTRIVNAALRIVKVFFPEVEVGIVFDFDEVKCIDNRFSQ